MISPAVEIAVYFCQTGYIYSGPEREAPAEEMTEREMLFCD